MGKTDIFVCFSAKAVSSCVLVREKDISFYSIAMTYNFGIEIKNAIVYVDLVV